MVERCDARVESTGTGSSVRDDDAVRADRPVMPGYGILDADEGTGLLPWEWAQTRLAAAPTWWVSTMGSGRPPTAPVWGVWADERGWFSTGPKSRKARNLAVTPVCTIAVEYDGGHVIVEGSVAREPMAPTLDERYRTKYAWDGPVDEIFYAVAPTVVFGMINTPGQFVGSATAWRP